MSKLITGNQYLEKGSTFLKEGKYKEALGVFCNLLNQGESDNAVVVHGAACSYMATKQYGLARQLFKRAIELDKKLHQAWCNLGVCGRNIPGLLKEAKQCFETALELNKDEIDYWINYASVFTNENTPEKAIELLNKGLEKNPSHPVALYNKSIALLELGDFEQAWDLYEYRFHSDQKEKKDYCGIPEWMGQNDKRYKIIVRGEQGLGDEIMFLSMTINLMKHHDIIIEVNPRLENLFKNSFEPLGVPVFGTKLEDQSKLSWINELKPDFRVQAPSLARFFAKKKENFHKTPYLKAEKKWINYAKEKLDKLGNKPKIGISWKGGLQHSGHLQRLIKLPEWKPILENKNFDFISLQYNPDSDYDISKLNEICPNIKLHHWQDIMDDIDKTAGLIHNLDLIISVPQTALHIGAAMGKKVWQLAPFKHMWQAGVYGQDLPWYGDTKTYWQTYDGKWNNVVEKVKIDLAKILLSTTQLACSLDAKRTRNCKKESSEK